jgi:hypothetical protein
MNDKNFDYLKEQVKYTGFGEGLENDLKEKMQQQEPNFKLYHNAHYENDIAVATLNFKKSEQSDMYFFNFYQVNLQKEHGKEIMEQTFYINKGNNITLKEAYNLMEGRAVNKDLTNKEGQVYNSWLQMNFTDADTNGNFKLKQYHQNYGYDLKEAFGKQSMKELNDPKIYDDPDFINSLKKGNLQSVIVMKGDTSTKVYVEANPQFKSINVYDANMQRLDQRQAKGEKQGEVQEQSVKQTKKEGHGAAEEGAEAPKEGQKKRSRQSNSM